MQFIMNTIWGPILGLGFVLLILAREDDVLCLRGFKSSIKDPEQRLDWSFSNSNIGFICQFTGVTCWNERENRIVNLQLQSMALSGTIPSSLKYCESITSLDLSGNSFSGLIPANVCNWLPYLVHLDLSGNQFSGPIPPDLSNCRFLNTLILDDNSLSGSIPTQLSRLNRLKRFSVSNNDLSGPIPPFLVSFSSTGFSGNSGLCGPPLGSSCRKHKNMVIIIAAGAFGATASILLGFALWRWCFASARPRGRVDDPARWIKVLKAHKLTPVSLYKKPIVKLKVGDLVVATNSFDPTNIIVKNRTGTSYKAVLRDGSMLMIKRLHACKLSEKQFQSEMKSLGLLRHPNLVPLLGYCIVQDERLLIYKHMSDGTLSSVLHSEFVTEGSGWPVRRRIGIGAAKGLAWLHHGIHPPVLHQNISSSAVFLDEEYEARIADFGLAQIMGPVGDTSSNLFHEDYCDLGYVAPECGGAPAVSLKGDVYAFGVILLELVSGHRPLEPDCTSDGFKGSLVDWVNQLVGTGRSKDVIDKSLIGRGHDDEILQVLKIAMSCVVPRPKDRCSMYWVYQNLRAIGGDDSSEQVDEFPLIFGRTDTVNQE